MGAEDKIRKYINLPKCLELYGQSWITCFRSRHFREQKLSWGQGMAKFLTFASTNFPEGGLQVFRGHKLLREVQKSFFCRQSFPGIIFRERTTMIIINPLETKKIFIYQNTQAIVTVFPLWDVKLVVDIVSSSKKSDEFFDIELRSGGQCVTPFCTGWLNKILVHLFIIN